MSGNTVCVNSKRDIGWSESARNTVDTVRQTCSYLIRYCWTRIYTDCVCEGSGLNEIANYTKICLTWELRIEVAADLVSIVERNHGKHIALGQSVAEKAEKNPKRNQKQKGTNQISA